jgi:hypothetical protein
LGLRTLAAVVALAACVSSCATLARVPCAAGETRAVSETLFFGTARPGGRVSAEEWQRFLEDEVTPRFAAGFTSWAAAGQWRGADGVVQHEDSFVVMVLHDPTPETDAAIRAIVAAYKSRFEQEAVLRVRGAACRSF